MEEKNALVKTLGNETSAREKLETRVGALELARAPAPASPVVPAPVSPAAPSPAPLVPPAPATPAVSTAPSVPGISTAPREARESYDAIIKEARIAYFQSKISEDNYQNLLRGVNEGKTPEELRRAYLTPEVK